MARHHRSLDKNDSVLWMLVVAKNDRHALQLARERVLDQCLESLRCLRRIVLEANALFDLPFDDGLHGRASHPLVAISDARGQAVTSELQLRCKDLKSHFSRVPNGLPFSLQVLVYAIDEE